MSSFYRLPGGDADIRRFLRPRYCCGCLAHAPPRAPQQPKGGACCCESPRSLPLLLRRRARSSEPSLPRPPPRVFPLRRGRILRTLAQPPDSTRNPLGRPTSQCRSLLLLLLLADPLPLLLPLESPLRRRSSFPVSHYLPSRVHQRSRPQASLSPLRRGRRSLCPCQRGPAQPSMPLVGQSLAARCLGPRVRDPQMNPELKKIALWTVSPRTKLEDH